MNRLKALPWTQILLFLLLLATLVNHVKILLLKKSIDDVQWAVDQINPTDVSALEKGINESNQHLQEIEFSLRCMSSRLDPQCILAGRSHPTAP